MCILSLGGARVAARPVLQTWLQTFKGSLVLRATFLAKGTTDRGSMLGSSMAGQMAVWPTTRTRGKLVLFASG